MSIDLIKGQKIDLTKTNPGLTKLNIGLGWDVNSGNGPAYDLDAFALIMKEGKLHSGNDSIIFFNKKQGPGVSHGGDNLTGAGSGDDEVISIDLSALPADCDEVAIGANIYDAAARGNQQFGMVSNAFIRAVNASDNNEIIKYDLSEDYSGANGVVFGKLYRHNGEFKFQALGNALNGDILQIGTAYQTA